MVNTEATGSSINNLQLGCQRSLTRLLANRKVCGDPHTINSSGFFRHSRDYKLVQHAKVTQTDVQTHTKIDQTSGT